MAEARGDAPALIGLDEQLSYAALSARSRRFASWAVAEGLAARRRRGPADGEPARLRGDLDGLEPGRLRGGLARHPPAGGRAGARDCRRRCASRDRLRATAGLARGAGGPMVGARAGHGQPGAAAGRPGRPLAAPRAARPGAAAVHLRHDGDAEGRLCQPRPRAGVERLVRGHDGRDRRGPALRLPAAVSQHRRHRGGGRDARVGWRGWWCASVSPPARSGTTWLPPAARSSSISASCAAICCNRRHRSARGPTGSACAAATACAARCGQHSSSGSAIPRILEFYAATEGGLSLTNAEGRPGRSARIPPFLAHRFPVALVRCDDESGLPLRDAAGRCVRCAEGEPGEAIAQLGARRGSRATRTRRPARARCCTTCLPRGTAGSAAAT